jgi:hypothetical protein
MQWLNKTPHPSQEDILQFHQFTGDGDINNDLMMNRDGKMLTVSVTGIELDKCSGKMQYKDLMNNRICLQQLAVGILKKVA